MSTPIRPLERDDLPQVAGLYELVARSGSRTAPPGLADHFEQTFLDHPWADPEIPSLVYQDSDGTISGFLGSHVRRMRVGDRTVRLGCSGHLVTEPEVRNRAAGAFLMRAYMSGPQELTFTDTASDLVRRIWASLGGETSQMSCVGWFRIFQPGHFAAEMLGRREKLGRVGRAAEPVWSAIDLASRGVARAAVEPPITSASSEPLTSAAIVEHLPAVASSFRLQPAYEEETFVAWLLDAVAAVKAHGERVARLVRGPDGHVRGWYVYYLRPRGIAQVLQVAAGEREVGEVLDQLFHDASSRGASGVQGRVEAHLFAPLQERRCLFHRSGYLALIHSREVELLYLVQAGHALLTRLEGEWWMGHHSEPFGGRA